MQWKSLYNNIIFFSFFFLRFKNLFGRKKSGAPINWRKINE